MELKNNRRVQLALPLYDIIEYTMMLWEYIKPMSIASCSNIKYRISGITKPYIQIREDY